MAHIPASLERKIQVNRARILVEKLHRDIEISVDGNNLVTAKLLALELVEALQNLWFLRNDTPDLQAEIDWFEGQRERQFEIPSVTSAQIGGNLVVVEA